MNVTITPGLLRGAITPPPSKSQAHRLLIAAALADGESRIEHLADSQDIQATRRCMAALKAPGEDLPVLDCGESGSTLRFLIPVALALRGGGRFTGRGRLMERPQKPYFDLFDEKGIAYRQEDGVLTVQGRLTPGTFALPGDVSSQFVTGLLYALPLLEGESTLTVTGPRESVGYVDLTLRALAQFGVVPAPEESGWRMAPQPYHGPSRVQVEGDWSNAAPWLCLGALGGESVTVKGMDPASLQGDKAVCDVLAQMGARLHITGDRVTAFRGPLRPTQIDARDIPDLVPVLAAVAAAIPGTTTITGAARLRLKESDRLATTAHTLRALGAQVEEREDGLVIQGRYPLRGGTVDAAGDHRIAMAAAVAAGACEAPVTITGAQAVDKSYPAFWRDLAALGKGVEGADAP